MGTPDQRQELSQKTFFKLKFSSKQLIPILNPWNRFTREFCVIRKQCASKEMAYNYLHIFTSTSNSTELNLKKEKWFPVSVEPVVYATFAYVNWTDRKKNKTLYFIQPIHCTGRDWTKLKIRCQCFVCAHISCQNAERMWLICHIWISFWQLSCHLGERATHSLTQSVINVWLYAHIAGRICGGNSSPAKVAKFPQMKDVLALAGAWTIRLHCIQSLRSPFFLRPLHRRLHL